MTKTLLTGAAGFIGMHTALRLLARGEQVIGVDNLNDYYDVSLKHARLARLTPQAGFSFHALSVEDREALPRLFVQ
jgi:UDP-glucuronate 4-epimerase